MIDKIELLIEQLVLVHFHNGLNFIVLGLCIHTQDPNIAITEPVAVLALKSYTCFVWNVFSNRCFQITCFDHMTSFKMIDEISRNLRTLPVLRVHQVMGGNSLLICYDVNHWPEILLLILLFGIHISPFVNGTALEQQYCIFYISRKAWLKCFFYVICNASVQVYSSHFTAL